MTQKDRGGRSRTFGAVSVVNAVATGKGASLGVELRAQATVELRERGHVIVEIRGARGVPTALARACVMRTLEWAGRGESGAWVETESEIPMARGLKSSSAAANAIVLATLEALDRLEGIEDSQILRLGVEAAKQAGVTITGAYDDACATLLGGLCITDNGRMELVKRQEVDPDLVAVIHVPDEEHPKSQVARHDHRSIESRVASAWERALSGDFLSAMAENGAAYANLYGFSMEPAHAARSAGALSAGLSGTGPATAALCEASAAKAVERALSTFGGRVIVARVNNRPGGVLRRSS